MSLDLCTDLWGEAHLMYGNPPLRIFYNAAFLPHSDTEAWGVYDAGRNIIEDSLDLRGSSKVPHSAPRPWPAQQTLDDVAPDDLYIYCGWLNPHFGHFLINSFSKFWPFFQSPPRAKVLIASPLRGLPAFIHQVLAGLGLDETSVVSFDRPTLIRQLLVPTPAMLEQYWIYSLYRDLCIKAGRGAWTPDEVDSIETPVYLSKSRLKLGVGRFQNEDVIEDVVRSAGIDIAYPEEFNFQDQIKLFATRKLIVGPTGSAFHTALFAPAGRNILCYNPTKEINANFALIDKVCQNNSQYYVQPGMTYEHTNDFITVVNPANAHQLGDDLVELARRQIAW